MDSPQVRIIDIAKKQVSTEQQQFTSPIPMQNRFEANDNAALNEVKPFQIAPHRVP